MAYSFTTQSLQTLCINQAAISLENYTPKFLSFVPPALRHQIFSRSPIVDICRFEKTCAFDSINANKLWGEIYGKHWKCYDQWQCDETITTRCMEMISDRVMSNREKYFILLTAMIFSGERPSGYFGRMSDDQKRIDYPPPAVGVVNDYPTDIVNFLVAASVSTVKQVKKSKQDSDGANDDSESWYPINNFPVPQRDLDDQANDARLSGNYNKIATVNQRVPQVYSSLVKSGSRISDEDAIMLMMDKCNYYPKLVPICAKDCNLWSWKEEDLEQIFTKFFQDVAAILLSIVDEPEETSNLVVSTCFRNRNVPCTLYLSLLYELSGLHHLMSEISNLSLEKLNIYSPFDFELDDDVSKELGEILSHQSGSMCEFKLRECSFPEESSFLFNVTSFVQSPLFTKFSFEGYSEPLALVQLLNAFFSTSSSHSQLLHFEATGVIELDATGRDKLSPMPVAICDSSLQHKSLWLEYCSASFSNWLLRLKPLSLHNLHLAFAATTVDEFHSLLESIAHNDELRVCNLSLVNHYVNDTKNVLDPLSEDSLKSIFKRPLLKNLSLDVRCQTSSLPAITKALHVQAQVGALEKLKITFNTHEIPKEICDVELLLEAVFNLPQISRFSLDVNIILQDLTIVETIHKHWSSKKKPKEFRFGHFHDVIISGRIQNLLDEMDLVIENTYCYVIRNISGSLCVDSAYAPRGHSVICTRNLE